MIVFNKRRSMNVLFPTFLCGIFFIIFPGKVKATAFLPDVRDSTHDSLKLSGSAELDKIGLAPMPVLPFYKPVATASLSLTKKGWSYGADFSIGLNGRPWMSNNWFHYRLFDRKKLQVSAGINPFLYFATSTVGSKKEMINVTRNISFEASGNYKFSDKWALNFTYRYDHGFNNVILPGNFFCTSIFSKSNISKSIFINVNAHLIYFDYVNNIVGLFGAGEIIVAHKKFPLSAYIQGNQPFWAKFSGAAFIWNTGMVYSF